MTRIVIADDHAIVRQGLRRLIDEHDDLRVIAEAADSTELLAVVRAQVPDIVIMDLSMPGRPGLDVVKDLHAEFPQLPILVLSLHPEEHYALRTLHAGARGYIPKSSSSDELILAIRRVAEGRRYLTASQAELILDDMGRTGEQPPHMSLSDREFQVLVGLASGLSVTELAGQMSISFKTVSTYRARLLAKLHLRSNADLTAYAIEHALI